MSRSLKVSFRAVVRAGHGGVRLVVREEVDWTRELRPGLGRQKMANNNAAESVFRVVPIHESLQTMENFQKGVIRARVALEKSSGHLHWDCFSSMWRWR